MDNRFRFEKLFPGRKPLIACIHLLPLPGAPQYDGNIAAVYRHAVEEAEQLLTNGADGLIMENFRDAPFYPDRVPAETIAAMAAIGREIRNLTDKPFGLNVLRNDSESALAIATAIQADFIRVNIHLSAAVTDQGIIQGKAHRTLRLRSALKSDVAIFTDLHVKHASPLGRQSTEADALDLIERGLTDALILSGIRTGAEADISEIARVREVTRSPILIGSGITSRNIKTFFRAVDGFIVGSTFKTDGFANNRVDPERIRNFMAIFNSVSAEPNP